MLEGIVIKAYSSFYYVEIGEEVWECRLRGKFRLSGKDVLAGDRVKIKPGDACKGVIEEILPRTTELVRPPVANVDQSVLVFACADPDPQFELLNRMLVQAEVIGLNSIICFNKADLVSAEKLEELRAEYNKAGYRVIVTCTKTGLGLEELRQALHGHITVFAGPSGVGKSSLLNAVHPGFQLKTGKVSDKIGRGRHTTRFAELLKIDADALVVDSPGFSTLYIPDMEPVHLAEYFPEFEPFLNKCKFNGCLHHTEPGCAVKKGLDEDNISRERYVYYLSFLQELLGRERRY